MHHLFTLIFIFSFTGLIGGAELKGKILLAHDTLDVTLKVPLSLFSRQPVLYNLRSKIVYFDKKGQRKVLKAKEAKEVIFKLLRI